MPPSYDPGPLGRLLGARRPVGPALIIIGFVAGAAAAGFAYTAGWFSPARITPGKMVDALGARGGDPIGHRRNHAKGVCFTGYFEGNGAGAALSTAPMFAAVRSPVIGRFAIGVGDPLAKDQTGRVRSMAIRVVAPDGQEWRSGMNAMPFFPVGTLRAFYDLTVASDVDPKTGQPDPAAMKAFGAKHPQLAAFGAWAKTAPWTSSYADQSYNSINAFRFIDKSGASLAVRWSMIATTPALTVAPSDLAKLGPDFLANDLKERLSHGPLRWNLVAILGAQGDPTNDASKPWPAGRPTVTLGTLVVEREQDEAGGPCRDYNYDPMILPKGIAASDDPILAARSAAYANSFDRRTAEASRYPRTAASTAGGEAVR